KESQTSMQLSRILTAPLVVDVRRGAVADLGALLADQRIATEGRVAVAVDPSRGDSVLADLDLGSAEVFRVEDSTVDAAVSLGKQLRANAYEAVAGIGGGKTIDVTKFAAHMAGIPMVAVATNLSHDGIASPVSSLEHESGKSSYGVVPPVAVMVDLDRVRNGPPPAGHDHRRRLPHRAGRVADPVRDGHDRGRLEPPGQRRLPRDPVRDR